MIYPALRTRDCAPKSPISLAPLHFGSQPPIYRATAVVRNIMKQLTHHDAQGALLKQGRLLQICFSNGQSFFLKPVSVAECPPHTKRFSLTENTHNKPISIVEIFFDLPTKPSTGEIKPIQVGYRYRDASQVHTFTETEKNIMAARQKFQKHRTQNEMYWIELQEQIKKLVNRSKLSPLIKQQLAAPTHSP